MTTAKAKVADKTASVIETTQDQFAKAAETQLKAADEIAAFGKSNVDAFTANLKPSGVEARHLAQLSGLKLE